MRARPGTIAPIGLDWLRTKYNDMAAQNKYTNTTYRRHTTALSQDTIRYIHYMTPITVVTAIQFPAMHPATTIPPFRL